VSKHGAVAFAEWLSATYRHQGLHVHALCPQGVRTRMLDEAGPLQPLLTRDAVLEPDEVADALWDAMRHDRFLVLPHPEVAKYAAFRATQHERWLTTMNQLQQQLDASLADGSE
jgi:short-subunit dehydrogenase